VIDTDYDRTATGRSTHIEDEAVQFKCALEIDETGKASCFEIPDG
jgi:hypothetical protein